MTLLEASNRTKIERHQRLMEIQKVNAVTDPFVESFVPMYCSQKTRLIQRWRHRDTIAPVQKSRLRGFPTRRMNGISHRNVGSDEACQNCLGSQIPTGLSGFTETSHFICYELPLNTEGLNGAKG